MPRRLATTLATVLACLGLAVPAQAATAPDVLYVHGFIASSGCSGIDTAKQAAPLATVLKADGYAGRVIGVDWLCGDKNGANIKPYGTLPASAYNASIRIEDIATALAAYVRATYTDHALAAPSCVGHSMGGLICLAAVKLYGMPASRVVTYSTPNKGWDKIPAGTMGIYCGTWTQCQEMTTGSTFLTGLESAPKPVGTAWTCVGGSPRDNVATINSACGPDAETKVDYYATGVVNYTHPGYMTDTSQLVNVTAKVNGQIAVIGHSLRMGWEALR